MNLLLVVVVVLLLQHDGGGLGPPPGHGFYLFFGCFFRSVGQNSKCKLVSSAAPTGAVSRVPDQVGRVRVEVHWLEPWDGRLCPSVLMEEHPQHSPTMYAQNTVVLRSYINWQ